jgi:hypothetical protein
VRDRTPIAFRNDPDETEGRRLYRAYADAEARRQIALDRKAMADDRRTIAWSISKAAKVLPRAEAQQLRAFLNSLDGSEPAPRKVHSWKRKAAKGSRAKKRKSKIRAKRQGELFE